MMQRKKRKSATAELSWGRGAFNGYGDFRHGSAKPINLPPVGPGRLRPILEGADRDMLLGRAVAVMGSWRSSPWENEAAIRAGLRVGFIGAGNSWLRADLQAADIVASALSTVAPVRPTWEEGQRGHSLGSDFCHWCHGPIEEGDRSRGRRFCSAHCAAVAIERTSHKSSKHHGAVLRSAARLVTKEKAEPQTCTHCARSFQSDTRQRFCSISCAGLSRVGDRALHPRKCDHCDKSYKPLRQASKYCSQSCAQRSIRKAEAESLAGLRIHCSHCDTAFRPTDRRAIHCSKRCAKNAGDAAYRERNKAKAPPPARCGWCGDEYQPRIALREGKVGFCSQKCGSEKSRVARGARPRDLTRRTFDHYLALPVDEFRRRLLTTDKLDWLAMEMGYRLTAEATLPTRRRVTDALFAAAPLS